MSEKKTSGKFFFFLFFFFKKKSTHTFPHQVDIGQMAVFLASLAQQINCDMFAYDYSGYGCSSGKALEANLYADIDAVFDVVRTQ